MFDQHNATFVSVTQQFNTTTSMGRLTLNILLSFAQFERETISERTRDKYAASRRKGMYRYYTSVKAIKHGFNTCTIRNVAAAELEGAVIQQLRKMLSTPEVVFEVYCKARTLSATPISENAVGDALRRLDEIWDQLFPLEQRRLVRLLIHKVIVAPTGVRLQLNTDGVRMAGLEMEPRLETASA